MTPQRVGCLPDILFDKRFPPAAMEHQFLHAFRQTPEMFEEDAF